ncbi:hypothetical protein JTE90_029299 [Oedothorax gibbosus]|uniref:Reverse transcriptase domain-containing protein n=1 Tax=Oedothorax gibbosus TaxID=931172 RepID=A0AAV6TTK3_9ARAC|nr:hypothetical protein JTE90_029299 [Oedothorax gibbosus]
MGSPILNRGNSPTFITSQRSEVIDVTFCNAKAVNCISNWHVSERDYLSDHRLILFNLSGPLLTPPTGNRNPRKVDWDSYREELGCFLEACLVYGHIPEAWRQSKAVFIPKPGKADYSVAKAFRPICLSSFLLKTLEKMVDRYIRDEVLPQKPLSKFQYAYQPGKSTETALYDLFTVLDRAVNQKELALATFLDIEGAFDRVPTEAIESKMVLKATVVSRQPP